MTTLTFTVLKYGFIVLLWVFAWLVVRSLHRDIAVFLPSSKRSRARRKRAKGVKDSVLSGSDLEALSSNNPNNDLGYLTAPAPVRLGPGAAVEPLPATSESLQAQDHGSVDQMATAALNIDPEAASALGSESTGSGQPTLLTIIDGPTAGTTFPLTGQPISLGRAPTNTVVVDDEFVSGSHARVFLDPVSRRWMLEDLESTNGTYLDGVKIHGVSNLPVRVPVRVGATSFELR